MNPCVNYNIGFEYVRGGKVIIQNGEVCHVGDVVDYVHKHIDLNAYYAFDVSPSRDFSTNEYIYAQHPLQISIYKEHLFANWYQHSVHRNVFYHFLTAMTIETFNKICEFSYDYSFGSCFDDDDYILKIRANNITIKNVPHETEMVGGIHLYHGYTVNITNTLAYTATANEDCFIKNEITSLGTRCILNYLSMIRMIWQ